MQFGDVAAASKSGAWGLFSALGDQNPRADLLMELNAHSTAWFGSGGGVQHEQGVIRVAGDTAETLTGSDNDDFLIGGAGDDWIVSGQGHDAIAGEGGQDTLILSGAPSEYTLVAEGNGYRLAATGLSHYLRGIELFEFDGQVTITLAGMLGIVAANGKPLTATRGQDILIGNREPDAVDGRAGDDSIFGRNGDDRLWGSAGWDLLYGGLGNDTIEGGAGADTLSGGLGVDQMTGSFGDDSYLVDAAGDLVVELAGEGKDRVYSSVTWTLTPFVEGLSLIGSAAIDGTGTAGANQMAGNLAANRLSGLAGADTLLGGAGDDTLDGGSEADLMAGGLGDDLYLVDTAQDRVTEAANSGMDCVLTTVSHALAVNVENLMLLGIGAINGTGNAMDNRLTGNAGANLLQAGSGNDTVLGGGGADTLEGERGNDVLLGGVGQDVLTGGLGADQFVFANTASGPDVITDFNSAEGDTLRFDGLLTGSFVYLGGMGFSGGSDNTEARVQGGRVVVDVDGDGAADIILTLTGLVGPGQMSAADFVFL